MKKLQYLVLIMLCTLLNSCYMVGTLFSLGFRMGIYSVFIVIGLLLWVISNRGKRK